MSAPDFFVNKIRRMFNDTEVSRLHQVESLWSGYGEIARYAVPARQSSYITKYINLRAAIDHPRGWQSDFAHQRKLSSYHNEQSFYQTLSSFCNEQCRVPALLDSGSDKQSIWLIMEDLDASGFSARCTSVLGGASPQLMKQKHILDVDMPIPLQTCIDWLANFHGVFITKDISSVWPIGTYWFLSTRPDEFNAMPESALKNVAKLVDEKLNTTHYQTLLHGDAKIANFCFSDDAKRVAALDFQYAGRGCGVKDLIYLLGSYYSSDELYLYAEQAIDRYFATFRTKVNNTLSLKQKDALEAQWRALIPFAWADFQRFLRGWSPSHIKLNRYSAEQTNQALKTLR